MADFLDILAKTSKKNLEKGYYIDVSSTDRINVSLKQAIIKEVRASVISEIKSASPSAGIIREKINPGEVAKNMKKGGAIAISVLTEPTFFKGSLENLQITRESIDLPILMKDIIISSTQIEAAYNVGANLVLFIQALFDRGYCDQKLEDMISLAHSKKLEVLLETHNEKEFVAALETKADLVGINNRDLGSLEIDLNITKKILEKYNKNNKLIISESGIKTPTDLIFLHNCGADAFLIGSAIMENKNILEKVKEFVTTI